MPKGIDHDDHRPGDSGPASCQDDTNTLSQRRGGYCHWAQLRQGCIVVLSISQAMLVVTISPLPEQGDNTLPCQEGLVTISPPARAGLTQSTFCRDATVGADITNTIGLLASPEECPPGTTPLNTIHLRIKMLANVELIQSSCKNGVK